MLHMPMQKSPPRCSLMRVLKRQLTTRQQAAALPLSRATIRWQASWGQSQSELLSRQLPPWHHRQRALQHSLQLCTGPNQRCLSTLPASALACNELHVASSKSQQRSACRSLHSEGSAHSSSPSRSHRLQALHPQVARALTMAHSRLLCRTRATLHRARDRQSVPRLTLKTAQGWRRWTLPRLATSIP